MSARRWAASWTTWKTSPKGGLGLALHSTRGAVHAADDAAGQMGRVARGAVLGTLRALRRRHVDARTSLRGAAQGVVQGALEADRDLAEAAPRPSTPPERLRPSWASPGRRRPRQRRKASWPPPTPPAMRPSRRSGKPSPTPWHDRPRRRSHARSPAGRGEGLSLPPPPRGRRHTTAGTADLHCIELCERVFPPAPCLG